MFEEYPRSMLRDTENWYQILGMEMYGILCQTITLPPPVGTLAAATTGTRSDQSCRCDANFHTVMPWFTADLANLAKLCSTVAQMPFVVHPWLWMLRKAVQGCGLSGCNMIPKWCQDAVMLSNCFTLLYHVFVQHTVFGFKKLNSSNDSSLMEEKLRDLLAQPLLWHMLQIFADDFQIL